MSYERVLNALTSLGLPKRDAEIYVYLAAKGPQAAGDIADKLKLSKQQIGSSLQNLQEKKIVLPVPEPITKFSALPFEKTMSLLTKAKREETECLEQSRTSILTEWRSQTEQNGQKQTGANS